MGPPAELKDLARLFFRDGGGMRTHADMQRVLTDEEIDWLIKEGLIEMTAIAETWAWKGD